LPGSSTEEEHVTLDQGTLLVTGIGVVGAFMALWFAWRSASAAEKALTAAERAADAAERSATTSETSAVEAGRSADAAEASASEAKAANRLETERRHDELRPTLPAALEAFTKDSRIQGKVEVFATFQLSRDYLVQAVISGRSGESLVIDQLLEAGVSRDVHIATLDAGAELGVDAVRFRFWPSAGGETDWDCPCERPGSISKEPEGHWSVTVPVHYQPPPQPFAAWVAH
jgi:hypothetical protein